MEERGRKFGKDYFGTFFTQVAGFLLGSVSGIITARALGPAERGLAAVVLLYPSLFFTLSHLSVNPSLMHLLRKKAHSLDKFAGTLLWLAVAVSLITLAIYGLSYPPGRQLLYKGVPGSYLAWAMAGFPFLVAVYYFTSLLQGTGRIWWYNLINLSPRVFGLALVAVLAVLHRLNALSLILVTLATSIVAAAGALWQCRRTIPGPWSADRGLAGSLAAGGLKIHLGSVAMFLTTRLNLIFLNYFLAPAEVGYFYVALTLAELLWFISFAAEVPLYPLIAGEEKSEAIRLTKRSCRGILGLTLAGAAVAAAGGRYLILLYGGREYLPAALPLIYLLPGTTIHVVSKILAPYWIREGKFWMLTGIAGSTTLVSIVLNLSLIPSMGLRGAAIASSLAYFFNFAVSAVLWRRLVDRDIAGLLLPRRSDIRYLLNISRQVIGRV